MASNLRQTEVEEGLSPPGVEFKSNGSGGGQSPILLSKSWTTEVEEGLSPPGVEFKSNGSGVRTALPPGVEFEANVGGGGPSPLSNVEFEANAGGGEPITLLLSKLRSMEVEEGQPVLLSPKSWGTDVEEGTSPSCCRNCGERTS